jgi:hypothetical protein
MRGTLSHLVQGMCSGEMIINSFETVNNRCNASKRRVDKNMNVFGIYKCRYRIISITKNINYQKKYSKAHHTHSFCKKCRQPFPLNKAHNWNKICIRCG